MVDVAAISSARQNWSKAVYRTFLYMYVHVSLWCLIADVVMLTASSGMVNWVRTIHLKRFSTNIYDRIAGNFQGSKLSHFMVLWLFAKVFFATFGDVTFFGAGKTSNPQKFSPWKSYFSPICNSCLPRKFPVYTVFSTMSERNPLYGTIIHLSQRQHLTKGVLDNNYMSLTALLWDIVLWNLSQSSFVLAVWKSASNSNHCYSTCSSIIVLR